MTDRGRAEELFERLQSNGAAEIDRLIADHMSEELFLDFKNSADRPGTAGRLTDADGRNLSRAIGGFGNSEGGVIIWGVDCRPGPRGDVPDKKNPISDPRRFVSWLEGAVSGCTIPPHPGVKQTPIVLPGDREGFAATLVPKSEDAPLRSVRTDQYLIRAGSNFVPVPHDVLAGMFGRRPQPRLKHMWVTRPIQFVPANLVPRMTPSVFTQLNLTIRNQGRGLARDLFVNARVQKPGPQCHGDPALVRDDHWLSLSTPLGLCVISTDEIRLAPGGSIVSVNFNMQLRPPFEDDLVISVEYGCSGSPPTREERVVEKAKLQSSYDKWVSVGLTAEVAELALSELLGLDTRPLP